MDESRTHHAKWKQCHQRPYFVFLCVRKVQNRQIWRDGNSMSGFQELGRMRDWKVVEGYRIQGFFWGWWNCSRTVIEDTQLYEYTKSHWVIHLKGELFAMWYINSTKFDSQQSWKLSPKLKTAERRNRKGARVRLGDMTHEVGHEDGKGPWTKEWRQLLKMGKGKSTKRTSWI